MLLGNSPGSFRYAQRCRKFSALTCVGGCSVTSSRESVIRTRSRSAMPLQNWEWTEQTPMEQIQAIRAGLPANQLMLVAEWLQVSVQVLGDVVGISVRKASRANASGLPLDSVASERLLRVMGILREARETLGSDEHAREWLTRYHQELDCTPISLLDTALGAEMVRRVLQSISWGLPV
ncbi:antitoxin Xre/MbcA/ParS toxin-binding domain-containing protein [Chromobacterium vaccinii]|uniref:antitoxin Xre/MbcA/ParS toxin-binding domain-containing protein n=1 Tax=Chromobacterium vaccinii TaxID=1108595 RepID=UPI0009E5195F|nr:antitoxin Xre-like helix-turn-helix domain-containing protein [Chromobacterium vaccinii]